MSRRADLLPSLPDPAPATAETTTDPPAPTRVGTECRRQAPRTRPRPGAMVEARKWSPVPGHNVAVQLMDVSGAGVRILLRGPVVLGELYTLTLREPGGRRVAQTVAAVRWRSAERSGTVVAGLAFSHSISPDAVARLADPPAA